MKSDFRTSSRGWPRPLLCWAPSTLLLLTTLTTLLLNTEYSSAVISEHTTVDNSWIKLDENFPPRYDAAGHPYSRFFYARDKITDRMHLRNETIAEITGKDITMFHVQFDIWQNYISGCVKQVVLSKGLTERPERLNTPTDLNWNHVSEQYTEEQFKNFELWLYAQPDCNDSLFAIKDLTVTYNSYIRLEDKVKQPAETFIQLTPDDLELSVTGMEKHQYILQDKLCHKPEGCTLKIKLKKEDNLKVHFWSSVEGDKLTAGTKSHETPKQPETKIAVIELVKDTDLKKTTDNHYELTIRVVTATENSLAIVQIGDDDKREYEQVETPVGHWEQVNPSLFNEFLNNHKGKAQLLAHKADNATAKIGAEGTATALANVCHKVTYFAEVGQQKFTISADSVSVSADELVQSYPLLEFAPQSDSLQTFEFCVTDYIFDLKNVFKNSKVQLHLTTETNPFTKDSPLRKTAVVIEEANPKTKNAERGLNFIQENMKFGKYLSNLKWDSIVPGLQHDIKDEDMNPTNAITINENSVTKQTKQLFSKWLVNDIANINARPVVVELTLTGATTDELKNNKDFIVTATICDEIMECINTRKVETVDPLSQNKITYEFEFDAHPNAKSGHIKLRLAVGLPKSISAVVDLKSFGDPCFRFFKNVKSNDRCGINEKCEDKKDPKLFLANRGACTCNDNFIQNATGTCVEDQCNRPQTPKNDCDKATLDCQNTPDDKSFECVCPASATELQIWTNKKCEKLPDATQFKDNSVWIMPVGKVNPAIYDICYKFTPTVNPVPSATKPLAFTFSLDYTYTNENGISKKVSLLLEEMFKLTAKTGTLVDLCLSQLMDGYVTKNAILTATVKVQSPDPVKFAAGNSMLYSKEAHKQSPQTEHIKMISIKSLSIPFGYLSPASTLIPPDNEKQTINIKHTDYHKNDKMTVYSEWITIPEIMRTDSSNNLNLNSIKPEVSGSVIAVNSIQLCRPRNIDSSALYCAAYTEGNFVETLAKLEPANSKFQIVYNLIVQDEIKTIDVPKTTFTSIVSLFDACQTQKPECKSNGKCVPHGFTFQCEGGNCGNFAKGKFCDELVCTSANQKICDVQHSDCVQFENGSYHCRCPLGFESDEDQTNQKCHRKGVQSNIKRCSPDSPGECPFTNIITNEHFSWLPSNFPRIDATNQGQKPEDLYYAFRRASKLTVALQDKDKNEWVGQPNADVCIKFRYFVSKESTLTLHLIEPDNQAAPDLELVNLPSAYYDTEKNDATTTDAPKELSISPETVVCIKAFLPLGKLQTLEKFNLVFVADVQSQDGAVVVELLPYNAGSSLIQVYKDREEVPNKALRYLSQATVELDEKKADGQTVQSDFRYQWPVLVPENTNLDNRWKVETTPISPLVGSIAFKKGAIDGTKESVFIESAWIDRLLGRSAPAAAVNFYFKLDLPTVFKNTDHFNLEIVLLNANRQPILANGNQPSIAPAPNMDDILEKGMDENAKTKRKSKTFFLRLDQYEVPFGQRFKVQFRITFRNLKEFTGESFRISDFSFGDPCVEHKQKEGTDPEAAIKMRCQGVINDERKENKNAKCNRLPHPTAGTVDFQCECNDKALSGKRCELADNCKLKHKISAKNPDRQQGAPKVNTATGEDYCKKINSKNECRNVEIGDHDFACLCENKKQKFNFFTQNCTDIDDCVFNPCDFATELCSIRKDTKHRQCDCRPGYKRVNVNDTSCTPLSWEEAECPVEECSSTDPNMRCLSGEKDVHRCTCRKGFVMKRLPGSTDKWYCESEMCSFQGLHSCEQGCESTQTPPYYRCKCGNDFEPVENHQSNVTECHLKATSACKNWSGRYKTCIGGVPGCVSGYAPSNDGTACQPKATFKLEPACPSGAYRFDEAAKEYVCDCGNATLTRGYFTTDADMPATCKLTTTVCDAGQPGRNVCSRLGAGCLLDPDSLSAYSCACHLGRLFLDGRRVLTSAELAKLPLPTGAVACLDVCELPYRRSQCAAIGAQCNSRKLWTALHSGQKDIKAVDFCDCVSGTFAQTEDPLRPDTTTSCVQEGKALTLTLTIQWTADMQAELNKKMEAFPGGQLTMAQIMDQPTALQRHDPEGFARAEFRVIRANRAEASALTTAAAWQEEIRATVLAHQAATLLADFKLANKPGDLKGPETIVGTDVQVVQVQEAKIDGRLLAYTVQLAVRMPDRVTKAEEELQQLYLDYLDVEENVEQPEADAAATTTAAAATTTAAATTPATHLDQSLPKSVDLFNEVMATCVALEAESCIISYLPIILRKAAKLEPALHQPCTTGGLPACNGMSNCRPLNGSTFECLCGEGFDVEMSYTFKSAENKGLVVHKNEYCKAQDLCTSNCLDGDKTHTRCLHKAPSRDSATSHWVNSYSCDCVDKYVPQGANNGTCTYVCATLNCGGGDHGECVPAAKSASCRCKEGFYGEHCQHTVGSNTWWIVGIVVLGVLALAAIGAAVFFWRKS